MNRTGWLLLITLSLLWGGSFFFVAIAVGELPPLTVVLARVGGAALVLWLVMRLTGQAFPAGRAVWGALAVMAALNNVIPFTLITTAQTQIASALASILNATTPFFTVLVAHLATRDERITGAKLAGLVVGFGGVAVMIGGAALAAGTGTVMAYGFCLGAALSYGLSVVWARRFRGLGITPVATAFGQVIIAAAILLPLVLVVDRPWTLPLPSPHVAGAVAALAVVSTAVAYLIYFRLVATAGATNASLVTFLVPASAILLGVLVLGEALAPRHIAGLVLIAAGLALIDGRLLRRRRSGLPAQEIGNQP